MSSSNKTSIFVSLASKKAKKPKPVDDMEIMGESEKWYWRTINMLKLTSQPPLLFSESLPNTSHLRDPQSRSFVLAL